MLTGEGFPIFHRASGGKNLEMIPRLLSPWHQSGAKEKSSPLRKEELRDLGRSRQGERSRRTELCDVGGVVPYPPGLLHCGQEEGLCICLSPMLLSSWDKLTGAWGMGPRALELEGAQHVALGSGRTDGVRRQSSCRGQHRAHQLSLLLC